MSYKNKTLIFEEDKIYYTDKDQILEVMMDWEDSIMKASAEQDWSRFATELPSLTKSGTKVTWWNNNPEQSTIHNIENVVYETINVNPPLNSYFNSNKYYLPKKEF